MTDYLSHLQQRLSSELLSPQHLTKWHPAGGRQASPQSDLPSRQRRLRQTVALDCPRTRLLLHCFTGGVWGRRNAVRISMGMGNAWHDCAMLMTTMMHHVVALKEKKCGNEDKMLLHILPHKQHLHRSARTISGRQRKRRLASAVCCIWTGFGVKQKLG